MKNLSFVFSWYATAVCTLVFSLLFLVHLSFSQSVVTPNGPRYQLYKALPTGTAGSFTQVAEIKKTDARIALVTNFFKEKRSPLEQKAEKFIEVADKYNLDYKLLPAIAMQESNGGKIMPKNSYNPFGYGIYGGKVLRFTDFEGAIERVGRGLREDYLNQGLKTPEQIMAKYTPPSLQKGGAWAIGVSAFMEQLL